MKNKHLFEYKQPTRVPYFYDLSDYVLSNFIIISADDLYPNTAAEHGGLVKFNYKCSGGGEVNGTIRVDCLPYE